MLKRNKIARAVERDCSRTESADRRDPPWVNPHRRPTLLGAEWNCHGYSGSEHRCTHCRSTATTLCRGRERRHARDAHLGKSASEHLPERQVDPRGAGQRVVPVLESGDTVIDEARGTSPYRDIPAFDPQPADRIGAALPAP